jgi:hypothetical protein
VRFCAEQHAAYEVRGRDAWRALNYLEATGCFDVAVTVFTVAVGSDVIAVDNILAAVVGDPGERGHVGRARDGFGSPSAGFDGGDAVIVSCEQRVVQRVALRTARPGASLSGPCSP